MQLFACGGELPVAEEEAALDARVPFPLRVARVFGSVRYAMWVVTEASASPF